jgi:hypothetical protein
MDPQYVKELRSLHQLPPPQWRESFNNWQYMNLRTDLNLYEDYVILSQSSWLRLIAHFGGGAPEIMLQVVERPPVGKLELPL